MGKHINHFDVQDRIINRFDKQNKTSSGSLADKDPDRLTLAEQIELAEQRAKDKQQVVKPIIKQTKVRFANQSKWGKINN